MNEIDLLEKIIKHQQNKDSAYPFQEHLLVQLLIRANKKIHSNTSNFLSNYEINYSEYMVLTTLFTIKNHYLSPSDISQRLQFTIANISRITDSLEEKGYIKRTNSIEDRRVKQINLTSEGVFFINRLTCAQSMYLKKIWGCLNHDEQKQFEAINKKMLTQFTYAK